MLGLPEANSKGFRFIFVPIDFPFIASSLPLVGSTFRVATSMNWHGVVPPNRVRNEKPRCSAGEQMGLKDVVFWENGKLELGSLSIGT